MVEGLHCLQKPVGVTQSSNALLCIAMESVGGVCSARVVWEAFNRENDMGGTLIVVVV